MTLREVQRKYNYLPWVDYINALLPDGLKINENEVNYTVNININFHYNVYFTDHCRKCATIL